MRRPRKKGWVGLGAVFFWPSFLMIAWGFHLPLVTALAAWGIIMAVVIGVIVLFEIPHP